MNINVTQKEKDSQAEVKIEASAEEIKPYVEEAAKNLSKKHSLPGFRPGKAPVDVVAQQVGKEALLSEALDKAIPNLFVEAVVAKEIEALGRPAVTIEKADLDEGIAFTATVDVLPEVKVGDVSKVKVKAEEIKVDDERIDQELAVVAKSRSTYLDVARPAQEGDTVHVDFDVSLDGSPLPGGSSKNHPVHIGEGHFVPDFEEKIKGMQAGDTREFDMTFPDDYKEDLAGKKAFAKVKAHSVQKRVLPEIDDKFAKELGDFKDLADLKAKMKENMQKDLEHREEDRVAHEALSELAKISDFPAIPETLVDGEIDRRIQELAQMLQVQQKSLDDYLKEQKKELKDLRAELKDPALEAVKTSLVLRQFGLDQEIEATEKEVEEKIASYLQGFKDPSEAEKNLNVEELSKSAKNSIINEKAMKKLVEIVGKNNS